MENKKSKRVFKVVMAAMSLALVAAISYGATLAFMSSKTNDKTNTFTSSANVGINLTEDKSWKEDPVTKIGSKPYSPDEEVSKNPKVELTGKSDSAYVAVKLLFLVEDAGGTLNSDGAPGSGYKAITYNDFLNVASLEYDDNLDKDGSSKKDGINPNWQILNNSKNNAGGLILYYSENGTDLKELTKDAPTPTVFDYVKFKEQTELQKEWTSTADRTSTFCLYDEENHKYKNLVVQVVAYAVDSNMSIDEDNNLNLNADYPDAGDIDGTIKSLKRGQAVLNRLICGAKTEVDQ